MCDITAQRGTSLLWPAALQQVRAGMKAHGVSSCPNRLFPALKASCHCPGARASGLTCSHCCMKIGMAVSLPRGRLALRRHEGVNRTNDLWQGWEAIGVQLGKHLHSILSGSSPAICMLWSSPCSHSLLSHLLAIVIHLKGTSGHQAVGQHVACSTAFCSAGCLQGAANGRHWPGAADLTTKLP